jgi:hypothetical protein
VVTLPNVRLRPESGGPAQVPHKSPFEEGEHVTVLYRGMPPGRAVVSGPTFMYCTAVINTENRVPPEPSDPFGIFEMPRKYWVG